MKHLVNRRGFLSSTLGVATAPALASPMAQFFTNQEAVTLVQETLETYLKVKSVDRALVLQYIERLKTPGLHTEDPEVFQGWLDGGPGAEENLKAYILEEFIAHSNYFAVVAGEESKLSFRTGEVALDWNGPLS